jgi:hypothetical protein
MKNSSRKATPPSLTACRAMEVEDPRCTDGRPKPTGHGAFIDNLWQVLGLCSDAPSNSRAVYQLYTLHITYTFSPDYTLHTHTPVLAQLLQ